MKQQTKRLQIYGSVSSCSLSNSAIHSPTDAPFSSLRTIRQVLPHCSTFIPALLASTYVPLFIRSFSGFKAGLGVLMGPTGGYILGYIPMAALAGLGIQTAPKSRKLQLLSMAGATAVLYAFGTVWFCFLSGNSLAYAAKWCILPFIPGDLMKMAAAVTLGPVLRERLMKANIHPEG